MPISTMSLSSISSRGPISAKNISNIRNKLHMGRITTESILADMIKNRNISALSTGNRFYRPCIHESVNTVSNLINSNIPITSTGNTTSPKPTTSLTVYFDLSKDAFGRLGRNIINDKHFIHTHIVSLILRNVKWQNQIITCV